MAAAGLKKRTAFHLVSKVHESEQSELKDLPGGDIVRCIPHH